MEGQKTFRKYGSPGQCDHAIRLPGCRYEVGIVETANGAELRLDWFDDNLGRVLGGQTSLEIEHDMAMGKMTAEARGWTWQELVDENQERVLEYYEPSGGGDWSQSQW
jgi:hypothetical protein